MINMIENVKQEIKSVLNNSIQKLIKEKFNNCNFNENYVIEIPANKNNGDFATNIAMINCKNFKISPIELAKLICDYIIIDNTYIYKFEIKGAGFINFFVNKIWYYDSIKYILQEKENYGKNNFGENQKIMVEFVSANPTGPMHLGNARGGAIGDCLSSLFEMSGYDVTREFYINDAGNQIHNFGLSIYARYMQILNGEDSYEFPEQGYHGDDIKDLAKLYIEKNGDNLLNLNKEEAIDKLINDSLCINVDKLKQDLLKYRIDFDVWFSEQSLHDDDSISNVVDMLRQNGHVYEKDGAIWYNLPNSDKDEVLIRNNGTPSYFAADVAYHYNKFAIRKFDRVINIWGADHHGHVARLKSAIDALNISSDKLDIILMQLVKLSRNGEIVRMSKRTGKSITLSDLLNDLPIDSVRFFFNLRESNVHLEFDLDLAISQNTENPVYYIQYAYARICNIIEFLKTKNIDVDNFNYDNLSLLKEQEELDLIKSLTEFPEQVLESVKTLEPSKVNRYLIELASYFHKFYNSMYVYTDNEQLTNARLALCKSVKIVIENAFKALKITLVEKM